MKEKKRSGKRLRMFSVRGNKEIKNNRTLKFWFSSIVWALFLITAGITALIFFILYGILAFQDIIINAFLLITAMTLSSIIIGFTLAFLTPKFAFKRLSRISEGMREISRGNYKARVKERDKADALTEFGELERSFNQMACELEGVEIFRNDFINNFSHEFKTPIVSIRGFARRLQSDNLSEEQRKEYLEIIVSESEHLVNMSANILLLSKLENQQIVNDKTRFDLDEHIRKSILLLEKEWSDKDIELDIDLEPIKYTFNEEMLSHVFVNLFSNSIKFTPSGGKISCTLRRDGDNVVFKIFDNGIGMNEETMSRIFEKFYQGDTSHSRAGNGIGLNIVGRVVTLAGGSISVESEYGAGSTFTVILPYINEDASEDFYEAE